MKKWEKNEDKVQIKRIPKRHLNPHKEMRNPQKST